MTKTMPSNNLRMRLVGALAVSLGLSPGAALAQAGAGLEAAPPSESEPGEQAPEKEASAEEGGLQEASANEAATSDGEPEQAAVEANGGAKEETETSPEAGQEAAAAGGTGLTLNAAAAPQQAAAPATSSARQVDMEEDESAPAQTEKKEKQEERGPIPPPVDYEALAWGFDQRRVDVGVAAGLNWVSDDQFGMYSSRSHRPALAVHGSAVVWVSDAWSAAPRLSWETSGAVGDVRGQESHLRQNRFLLAGELRRHLFHRLFAFARVGGGLTQVASSVGEKDAFDRLSLKALPFTASLDIGASVRVLGSRDSRKRGPRLHVFAEGGFSYVKPITLNYSVPEDGPLRPAPVELGELSLSGPRLLAGLSVSF